MTREFRNQLATSKGKLAREPVQRTEKEITDCIVRKVECSRREAIMQQGVSLVSRASEDKCCEREREEKESVCSDESVHAKKAKKSPECLFVLNPRLFGIDVQIRTHVFTALLDSGATENFIAKKTVEKAKCRVRKLKTPMYVKVASGTELKVDGYVRTGLILGSIHLIMNFRIIEMDPDVVLGLPFLQQFDPMINWKRKTLRFNYRGRLVTLTSNSPYLASMGKSKSTMYVEKEIPKSESGDVQKSKERSNSEVFSIKTTTQEPFPNDDREVRKTENEKEGRERYDENLILLMHESIPIMKDSQELFLLRCIPQLHAIQNRDELSTEIANLLDEFKDVFPSKLPDELPPNRDVDHRIDLTPGSVPPACKSYRMAPLEEKELWDQLQAYLKDGKIEPAQSPFGAGVLFARKKDGTLRLCIDYRGLNAITIKDRYPIPRIDEQLDKFAKCEVFTKLDLASGYHQLRVLKDHIPRTAFNTQYGSYQWKVMPFGLTNAPATFQRMMNGILAPYLRSFAQVYLDDIIIYSKNVETHVDHVRKVLKLLRKNKLFCKLKKCTFAKDEVEFCGFLVSKHGIRTQPEKVQLIQKWPTPKDVSELKSFLGLCGFYQRFIPKYAATIACLTNLYKKDTRWTWSKDTENAFTTIKTELANAVSLAYPDFTKTFIVHLDASKLALGATLSQEADDGQLRLLNCTSRKFNVHELNYPVHEKEQLALIHCLEHWRHYLLGAKTIAYTDNIATRHIRTAQNPSSRQVRWLQVIERYDIDIRHIAGTSNKAADTLSRLNVIHNVQDENIEQSETESIRNEAEIESEIGEVHGDIEEVEDYDEEDDWTNAYAADEELMEYCFHANDLKPEYRRQRGLIWSGDQIVVPCSKITGIIKLHHATPTAGHFGISKTYDIIARKYWFPRMRNRIQQIIQVCDVCQRNKSDHKPTTGLLEPLQIPNQKWQSISVDWIVGLPPSPKRNDSILTVIDRLTHMVHLIPCKTTETAATTAQSFLQHIVRLHGVPRSIHSDRDPKLVSRFWKELCRKLGIIQKYTTPYHPSSNGLVERMNQTVEQVLRTALDTELLATWEEKLPIVEMSINNSSLFHSEYTPFYLNYGFHPSITNDVYERNRITHMENVEEFTTRMDHDNEKIHEIIEAAQQKMKQQADKARVPVELRPGDLVLFRQSRMDKAAGKHPRFSKILPKLVGPFTITKFISANVVELDRPIPNMSTKVINVSFLKRYRQIDDITTDDEEENEIECNQTTCGSNLIYHYNSDVKLDPRVFRYVCRKLNYYPDIDMFASSRHHQISCYCSLQDDENAYCRNCYNLEWSKFMAYLNPPWEEIQNALLKVQNDKANCLIVVPYWKSATWFNLLRKLTIRFWVTNQPLYLDENSKLRPSPRWRTCFAIVDGNRLSQ